MKAFFPLLSFLFLPSLLAEESNYSIEEITPTFAPNGSFTADFINMLITLGVLLTVVFFSLFFLKKLMRRGLKQKISGKGIHVIQRMAINPKSSLYLVDICGKGVVIAESSQGIHLITEFPPETDLYALIESEESPKTSFKEIMQKKGLSFLWKKRENNQKSF